MRAFCKAVSAAAVAGVVLASAGAAEAQQCRRSSGPKFSSAPSGGTSGSGAMSEAARYLGGLASDSEKREEALDRIVTGLGAALGLSSAKTSEPRDD